MTTVAKRVDLFSCLDSKTRKFRRVAATSVDDADKKMRSRASLIIRGTAERIGARQRHSIPQGGYGLDLDQARAEKFLKPGRRYDLAVVSSSGSSFIGIKDALFLGESKSLLFSKGNTMFWPAHDCVYFSSSS